MFKNEHWVALVPWWAIWPYEIMSTYNNVDIRVQMLIMSTVLPYKRHVPNLLSLTQEEKHAFAEVLSNITKRYDNLFSCSFAYSMGMHQRPVPRAANLPPLAEVDDEDNVAHLHLHFAPPLLRSASVRKFLVGYVHSMTFLPASC